MKYIENMTEIEATKILSGRHLIVIKKKTKKIMNEGTLLRVYRIDENMFGFVCKNKNLEISNFYISNDGMGSLLVKLNDVNFSDILIELKTLTNKEEN